MSEFYDVNKPYKISDWNNLVEAVNEILGNPPEDTSCEAIGPLPTVVDPHRWSTTDITEMRDILSSTCTEISFSVELKKWSVDIIAEIETELEKTWCDCDESEEFSISYNIPNSSFEAAGGSCGGAVFCDWVMSLFAGLCCYDRSTFISPCYEYYNWDDNQPLYLDAFYSYEEAYDKTEDFVEKWNELLEASHEIDQAQAVVDTNVAAVDAAIAAYENCLLNNPGDPGACAAIKSTICPPGIEATAQQEIVNENVSNFQATEQIFKPLKDEADSLALEHFNELSGIPLDYDVPGNINLCVPLAEILTDLSWAKYINPFDSSEGYSVQYASKSDRNLPGGVRPRVTLEHETHQKTPPMWEGFFTPPDPWPLLIDISPSGNIYIGYPWAVGTEVVDIWDSVIRQISIYYPYKPFNCDMREPVTLYYGRGFGFNSLEPWLTDGSLGDADIVGELVKTKVTEDYTDEQTRYFELYKDWFATNPQYDDRHSAYC